MRENGREQRARENEEIRKRSDREKKDAPLPQNTATIDNFTKRNVSEEDSWTRGNRKLSDKQMLRVNKCSRKKFSPQCLLIVRTPIRSAHTPERKMLRELKLFNRF